ncbi:uncharacterized protein BYT42DRAFT_496001 [Radiomyces spectabilis]|uniref:uncharacterized protein n=1 Tax=Radiomyces spectabilis TaxID=64574 RepID=UPI00221F055B|nr:uncharacterized protein BYT42DRAFT_496001 [Radiomyces spectabilis]KAI8379067.1 hypothetical protein BYT42DRAFT_496001 [Radiomyces spectabilis]
MRYSRCWDRFEPYSHEDESDFDPTLQFYRGELLDHDTIQDMNLLSLSVTNPSEEETQADNVGEDMSPIQMMESIFTDLSKDELDQVLAKHDYDVDRAMEYLIHRNTTEVEMPPPLPVPADTVVKKRQVCRHYLAGECYRKDCWFAHDLQVKVCKFWLQGSCLKGDSCEFSHYIDVQEVATKITKETKPEIKFNGNDYPELSSRPTKKSSPQVAVSSQEEFPSLTSAAKMRSARPAAKIINFAEAAKKKASSNTSANKKSLKSVQTNAISKQRLRQPVRIPWLETGSALNATYLEQRKQAIEYGMLRNRFFSRATEFYLNGDGAKAKAYSLKAKHYNRLMQEMHTEASRRIFEQRNQSEAFVDLHGLHVDEALDILEERLDKLKGYQGTIYIVTGTGHHSGSTGLSKKQSKLKPNVEQYLKDRNVVFAETSVVGDKRGGVFAVDLSR